MTNKVYLCNHCGGETETLGSLGWTIHYRCLDCGAGFKIERPARTKEEQKAKARWLRGQRKEKARIQKWGYE